MLTTISSITIASADDFLPDLEKPDAMLNWQLGQKLTSTKPDLQITFYQAIEGHYSILSNAQFRFLENYPDDKIPTNEDLMIISEMSVLSAIADQQIDIQEALNNRLITINGDPDEVQIVKQWLKNSLG
ncbi:hypothetical protein KP803_12570 [Vibrio sp. ZSDE26]|uniref:SCP2 domain-containing protein n=1 Tax=Vibrio amylolyticus TaxID=2847292 RepID=A0A9X1XJX1_9VIBR|nr:hypothetical protein [Vibrio amylolyticus]MCK6264106.1 hypothetical protein [Vibrio amylolyticus]